jgi:hypothetical protein
VIIIWMKSFKFRFANGSAALLVLFALELLELEGLDTDPTDMVLVPLSFVRQWKHAHPH